MTINLVKWRLMLLTFPITAVVVFLKIGIVQWLHFDGLVSFSETGLVFTGGIFLVGFMLAGTLADYKESEKIPAEMASTIESIYDTVVLAYGFNPNFDLLAQKIKSMRSQDRSSLILLTRKVKKWSIKDR
ncbi:MAG: hypothetical protein IPP15_15815 [Saprospiraceae bacterium]|uniref:Uncharacterized protein n=1 Tax=Candidatus Opimibacter skivensis TaxID=2982028 RepID=A0A9D7SY48_9BACT|nr:hypothetical protein [Candidatus Opimibacter skivensis]